MIDMIRLNLFKQERPKEFNLKPRYYDERKERLAKLKQKYDDTENGNFDRKLYREHLQESWAMKREMRKSFHNWRVLLIFAFIILLLYWVFN